MTEDIRIYDWEFHFLCNVNRWSSLNWTLKYNDIGSFEGHFENNSKIVDVILSHKYLVAMQGNKQAIIIGYRCGEDFAVFGRQVNWLLSRRVTPAVAEVTQNVEAHTRGIVANAFSDANFTQGVDVGYTNTFKIARDKSSRLDEAVKKTLDLDHAGHNVFFDIKKNKWRYDVLRGTVRKKLLSKAYNMVDMQASYDMLDYYNAGLYNYQPPEGEDGKKPEPVETPLNGTETGIYKFITLLNGATEAEAKTALAEKAIKESYTSRVQGLQYGKNYELGDTLRMQFEVGKNLKTIETRVVGVNLSYGETYEEEPILEEDKKEDNNGV